MHNTEQNQATLDPEDPNNNLDASSGDTFERQPPRLHLKTKETVRADGKSNKVRSFYEKGLCKHGRKGELCRFSHPKMCKKFLIHGHKKGRGCNKKECSYHHPPICKSSLQSGTCYKEGCRKRHLANTAFQKPDTHQKNIPASKQEVEVASANDATNISFLVSMLEKLKEEIAKEMESKIRS